MLHTPYISEGKQIIFFYSRYGRDTTGTYRIVPPHFFLSLSVSLFFAFHPVIPPHFFLAFLSLGLSVLCVSSSRHTSLFLLLLLLLLCSLRLFLSHFFIFEFLILCGFTFLPYFVWLYWLVRESFHF